jgi:hypothetical protein
MIVELTLLCRLVKIRKWGIYKRTEWANGKNQKPNCIYCPEKLEVKPPYNRKRNIRLSKKNNQWCLISKK